jgi:peptidoglycan/xylan/chitin deacetylase (PgdA/CDA1 family)
MSEQILAILSFHKIGDPPAGERRTWFYIPEAVFASQLTCLREGGWTVIDAAAFVRGLDDPGRLPLRSALLTFDDGYRTLHSVALPWLRRFEYPAVAFIPTDFIGGSNGFDDGVEPAETLCDWGELRELERSGVSVQSHGASHRRFSDLSPEARVVELRSSKEILEAGLCKPVELFAYPYGDGGPDASSSSVSLASAGYRAGFLYKGGPAQLPAVDHSHLPRLPMGPDTDLNAALRRCE